MALSVWAKPQATNDLLPAQKMTSGFFIFCRRNFERTRFPKVNSTIKRTVEGLEPLCPALYLLSAFFSFILHTSLSSPFCPPSLLFLSLPPQKLKGVNQVFNRRSLLCCSARVKERPPSTLFHIGSLHQDGWTIDRRLEAFRLVDYLLSSRSSHCPLGTRESR